jgi:hypothetical protein
VAYGEYDSMLSWTDGQRIPMMYVPDTDNTSAYYKRFRIFAESLPMQADCVMGRYADPMDQQICHTLGLSGSRTAEMYSECRVRPAQQQCLATANSDSTMQRFCAQFPDHEYCACGAAQLSRQFDRTFPVAEMRQFKTMFLAAPNCWSGHQCRPGVAYMNEAAIAANRAVCNYKICIQTANLTGDNNITDKILMGIDCSTTTPGNAAPDAVDNEPPVVVDTNQPGYSNTEGETKTPCVGQECYLVGGENPPIANEGDARDIVDQTIGEEDTGMETWLMILIACIAAAGVVALLYYATKNDEQNTGDTDSASGANVNAVAPLIT